MTSVNMLRCLHQKMLQLLPWQLHHAGTLPCVIGRGRKHRAAQLSCGRACSNRGNGHSFDGTCIVCLQASTGKVDVAQLCGGAANQLYMLAHCQGCIHVVLATSCMPAEVLKAFVHARVLALMSTQDDKSDQVIAVPD